MGKRSAGLRAAGSLLALMLLAGVLSCRQQIPPEIIETQPTLIYTSDPAAERIDSHIELHIHLAGEQEEHGIRTLQVAGPASTFLLWNVDADHLFTRFEENELWVGTNALEPPPSGSFPSGRYTVSLEDTKGLRDEMDFTIRDRLRRSEETRELFPRYEAHSDMISSPERTVRLRAFDSGGNPLGIIELEAGRVLESQRERVVTTLGEEPETFELEVTDSLLQVVLRSGPYSFRR